MHEHNIIIFIICSDLFGSSAGFIPNHCISLDSVINSLESGGRYRSFYNGRRPHTANHDLTPGAAYFGGYIYGGGEITIR